MRRRSFLTALLALMLGVGLRGSAEDTPPACHCREGNACWHYLRAPEKPPDDPCSCRHCEEVKRHGASAPWPESWRTDTFPTEQSRMDAFLRRHAASWSLLCNHCDRAVFPGIEDPSRYPFSEESGKRFNPAALEMIRKQAAIERELLGWEPLVIESPHFYLVTDIPELKIRVKGLRQKQTRMSYRHELGHVFVERLEKAYGEFVESVGTPTLRRPVGVFLIESTAAARLIQEKYLCHPKTTVLLGGSGNTVSKGHCAFGLCVAMNRQDLPGYPRNEAFAIKYRGGRKTAKPAYWEAIRLLDDEHIHLRLRHLVGHVLMAAWPTVKVQPENLPPWIYVGSGHWMSRRHHLLGDLATYCGEECEPLAKSGKKWDEKVRRLAADPRRAPPEEVVAARTMPNFNDFDLHLRAWSWFEIFLRHDRERFMAFLRAVRGGEDANVAIERTFGMSLEAFDRRWADLVLRRRPDDPPDEADPDAPRASPLDRRAIGGVRKAEEPKRKAALVGNLPSGAVRHFTGDVVALLGHPSAHVRETAVELLVKSTDEAVGAFLRTHALSVGSPLALANLVRILGLRGDAQATDSIRDLLDHGDWLVRANAARTLAGLARESAGAAILAGLGKERSPKAAIAQMAALGRIRSQAAVIRITTELGATDWQVRAAAAEALGRIGSLAAVEDLLVALGTTDGRVREEVLLALRRITGDDLGRRTEHWRDWWKKEKARRRDRPEARPADPEAPERPEPPALPPDGPDTEAPPEDPTYYGVKVFSNRVGFVLDASKSMETVFYPTEALQRRLRRAAGARPRIEFARDELGDAIQRLDARASFNIWTFHDVVARWRPGPVPATASNKARAHGFVKSLQVGNATNYYDAFRSVFSLPEFGPPSERFRPTPDTLFFLTDGEPTVGDITDTDELLAWFREENRFARVRCHVVAFGDKNLDFEFLTTLARETGGEFIHLKER